MASEAISMFDYNFHWRPVMKSLPDLLEASLLTLQVAVFAMVFGIIIGLGLALVRLHLRGPFYWLASIWIELARNTPALFQLFFLALDWGPLACIFRPISSCCWGLPSTVPDILRRISAVVFRRCRIRNCAPPVPSA